MLATLALFVLQRLFRRYCYEIKSAYYTLSMQTQGVFVETWIAHKDDQLTCKVNWQKFLIFLPFQQKNNDNHIRMQNANHLCK